MGHLDASIMKNNAELHYKNKKNPMKEKFKDLELCC